MRVRIEHLCRGAGFHELIMTKEEEVPLESAQTVVDAPKADPIKERERVPRKKRVPDTSYLKAPKVVPGGAVICVSRLPHGFYEPELRSYLAQFGEVTRLRLSRNPRTGASRHYAFVEFRHAEVARIVVETMHNYLLMGHLLQCQLVPEERIHQELWKGANRKFVKIPWRKMEANKYNSKMEKSDEVALEEQKYMEQRKKRYEETGIEYDLDNVITGELVL